MIGGMQQVRTILFKRAFILLVLVGILNFVANKLYFYWTLHYFDSLVHFLAGITVGLASVWFFSRNKVYMTQSSVFLSVFIGVFVVGIVWEVFELVYGITSFSDGMHYVTDTSLDIGMDMVGGVLAGIYSWKLFSQIHVR